MHHDHQVPTTPARQLGALHLDVASFAQPDTRSPNQHHGQGADTLHMPVPGGASIMMKDSAGTSMSLNVDIDPSSGTPILSGRAVNAQGDVLDVHPCSCNDPIASRHNLPMPRSPELSRARAHAHDRCPMCSSPNSPLANKRRPTPIFTHARTPLVLVQALLPQSPSAQHNSEASAPETYDDALGTPFTATPASMLRRSRSPSAGNTFHTHQPHSEETSASPLESQRETSPSLHNVPPRLDSLPVQSAFDPDLDAPLVESPSSIGPCSGISDLGSLPSFSSSGFAASTVMPRSHPVANVQPANEVVAESRAQEVSIATGVASGLSNLPECNTSSSTSDLYTSRDVAAPSMPIARIGSYGDELRYDLLSRSESGPMTELTYGAPHTGNVKGTWVANPRRDHMALKLDLSLDGLGLQNLSLSVPNPRPSESAAAEPAESPDQMVPEPQSRWETNTNSSQSIVTFGSCPSTAPPLSDLPLTPIPELLNTPTKPSMPIPGAPSTPKRLSSYTPAHPVEPRRPLSELPSPIDNEPILAQLAQGENDVNTIRTALRHLAREWQTVAMMPDGVALCDVEDDCAALYHALADLSPVVVLTWPPMRQPSLGTDGGQQGAREQLLHLEHMGGTEQKWYLKQHEFTTSLQRNLTRLTLLAQRVREDTDAAYRGNALERISQFTAKFEDIALRLKLAHYIRVEQKYRTRVRHAARRAVNSPEQAAAHEHHKGRLAMVRDDIEQIKYAMRYTGSPWSFSQ